MPTAIRSSRLLLIPSWLIFCACAASASNLTGTVTDGTTGKPSSGDTIGVVNMAQSMDEIAKTTSDPTGSFHVNVPDNGQLLLHVTHRGADYFKTVAPGTSSVDIEVYDAAAKIAGIAGEALVLRAETDPSGKTLNVSENFFVQNASTPPRTEFGGNTFDFYLPEGAQISQSLASAPNGLPTNDKLAVIDATAGHYAFKFPIRPGETRFQVLYTLPYSGKLPFSIKLSVPTGDVAVMLPKTMQFASSGQFQPIAPDAASQSFDAHQPAFDQPILFSISGAGQLPQNPASASDASQTGGQPAQSGQSAANDTRPGGGLGVPDDPGDANNPLSKYKWWIFGALGLALATGAGIMLKANPPAPATALLPATDINSPAEFYAAEGTSAPPSAATRAINPLLHALKQELFELETDRLTGKLTDAQYAEHKAAFDVVLRRALSRADPAPPPSIG